MSDLWQQVGDGVWCIDVVHPRPGKTCCYLIVESGRGMLIDCGAKKGVDSIMGAIAAAGLQPQQIEWLVPTHAHLDHAGATGLLMRDYLPNAVMAAHTDTVRHLTAPAGKLVPAARALYGEKFYNEEYEPIVAVEKSRTRILADNDIIAVGDSKLEVLYTPGHAWHHLCLYDRARELLFAGDAYGVSYRAVDLGGKVFIVPVMPPNQLSPEAMCSSLRRLDELHARRAALAHFGIIDNAPVLAEAQLIAIDEWKNQARQIAQKNPAEEFKTLFGGYLRDWYKKAAVARGFDGDTVLQRHAQDMYLTINGIAHWVQSESAKPA